MYRIGFDVGGTFTDFTLEGEGRLAHLKVASTPDDPARAIAEGLTRLLAENGMAASAVTFVAHGTTVATNMAIERRGAATGLVTTGGCRDVLEIGRQTRPALYDYSVPKPEPLVPRRHRLEVTERLDPKGDVVRPLDEAGLASAIDALLAAEVRAVAVCFLHSYANPAHERRAKAALAAKAPGLFVSLSSEVLPEFREFERFSTTALNAYVGPRMSAYLAGFERALADLGIGAEAYTVHSNGGLMSARTARAFPVRTCLSGPAAGVIGAARIAAGAGFPDVVTFDAGGTSTDVALVQRGRPLFTTERLLAGLPLKCPMLDVHVVGAGGGSIARVDDAGALHVGPQSAGAAPGPAAYGRGGQAATLTDANLVLGRLGADGLLGGVMPLDIEAARAAVVREVAAPLGLSLDKAAFGIVRIAVSNMARAIRSVSTERGVDLSGLSLIAYGGAGPLHAAEVAAELGMARIIVPASPGTLCARGILLADISRDDVATLMLPALPESWVGVLERLAALRRDGEAWLDGEAVSASARRFEAVVEARYLGQNHEVAVALGDDAAPTLDEFIAGFAAAHERLHGYRLPARVVEIVNLRLKAIGAVPRAAPAVAEVEPGEAVTGRRPVYFGEALGRLDAALVRRARLAPGHTIAGPAVVEEMSATTIVLPGQHARIDAAANLVIETRAP
jgi:N-methylhydantoinase A